MNTLVHFGAGNIGRALIGPLFSSAGWRIVFVDADPVVTEALATRDRYLVRIREHEDPADDETCTVTGFTGLHVSETDAIRDAVAEADLLSTAVGGGALPAVVASMTAGLRQRQRPVSVLLCENLRNAAACALSALIQEAGDEICARVGFVETSIGKMVPIMPQSVREHDPLEVWAERYNRIVADCAGFIESPPEVPGLVLKEQFKAHVECKLYIHNMGHAAAAYHGFLHGHKTICQALSDPWIRAEVYGGMSESAVALTRAYPDAFSLAELQAHRDDLLHRFANPALGDTVYRVGRDLPRKLGPDDRCAGALALAARQGGDPEHICRAIAAALCFRATDEAGSPFPADESFHRDLAMLGPEHVLREMLSGIPVIHANRWVGRILHRLDAYQPAPVAGVL